MALFKRNKDKGKRLADGSGDERPVDKPKRKRPANTAFKQQRLKAWQPILTPKSVLPTLFAIGLLFAPIGAVLIWGSNTVTSITLNYTDCDTSAPTDGTFEAMSGNRYDYNLASGHSGASYTAPTWSFTNDSSRAIGERAQCVVRFQVPYDLDPSVFLYYKLTNYYQNHRRYVLSLDKDQLIGHDRTPNQIDDGQCTPITLRDGVPIYPCGLIANSVFNDTFTNLQLLNPEGGSGAQAYPLSERNIAWDGESKHYTNNPPGVPSDYAVPPNWLERYPNGYESFPPLADDEHFQVWMRTSALPTFSKLWGRNDDDVMNSGTYEMTINMNYPVRQFSGTKSVVFSTVSWMGGKNPFLGWAYVATAILFVVLAVAGTAKHLLQPRRMGDMSMLSWNQNK
ncbi:hypothetical protein FFLO_05572 [Filobasidium floriforme]|uniref:Transcription regulator n=1 Tax=Filobasidium floriforme TaxID=5210 RepID=A0A8K0NN30_9TREE|nr:transcription regulator [Filobasidium floriforme]KAG7529556.1 hypothetical protein FFLO_05572 [Filobasidium floriforme]KAH8078978.1 transcription regulator [Filobasidium floriforme]